MLTAHIMNASKRKAFIFFTSVLIVCCLKTSKLKQLASQSRAAVITGTETWCDNGQLVTRVFRLPLRGSTIDIVQPASHIKW